MNDKKSHLSKINAVLAIVISLIFILSSSVLLLGQTQSNSFLSSPAIPFTTNASYDVNFTETGLSTGTQWNVTLNNVSEISTSSVIVFSMTNGTYAYSIASISGFTSSPSTGNITVSGSKVNQAISFTALSPVLLSPVNLGNAANFAILAETTVTNTGTSSITGNIGLSPAAASFFTGFSQTLSSSGQFSTSPYVTGDMYAANYASPTPTMLTASINDMKTAYTNAQGRTNPGYINLGAGNVNGMTLVPGLYKWSTGLLLTTTVTLKGNASSVWIFQIAGKLTVGNGAKLVLSGGALPKNIFWSVASGVSLGTGAQFSGNILSQTAITIATGASLNGRALAQTAVTLQGNDITAPSSSSVPFTGYNVIFTESGLPSGTSWNVTIGNVIKTSTTDTITFNEFNGTYSFSVASNSTDKILPSKGNIVVNGVSSYQAITFVGHNQNTYEVTFTETGLSTGTVWNVALNGITTSSNNATISFFEINGTYSYSIGSVSGYTVSSSTGSITVIGKNVSQSATFTASSTPTKSSSSGNSNTDLYIIAGVVIVAAVIGTAAAVIMRKKK
ncbi:MAG: ice-binding family protein [Thermoplasmataceae archaeon]